MYQDDGGSQYASMHPHVLFGMLEPVLERQGTVLYNSLCRTEFAILHGGLEMLPNAK